MGSLGPRRASRDNARVDLETIDWQWYERRADTVLRLFYRYAGPPQRRICRVVVRGSADTVEVGLSMPAMDSKTAALRGCIDVPLLSPLRDRHVVDALTGRRAEDAD